MDAGPGFEEYLMSKKIDSDAFRKAEPEVWSAWKSDFDKTHPNSFTVQKLNLINPVRRKYLLATPATVKSTDPSIPTTTPTMPARMGKPVMGKPVMKPKPDIDPNSTQQ